MKPCSKETKRLELELGGQELTPQVYILFLVQKEKKKKEEAGRESGKGRMPERKEREEKKQRQRELLVSCEGGKGTHGGRT